MSKVNKVEARKAVAAQPSVPVKKVVNAAVQGKSNKVKI